MQKILGNTIPNHILDFPSGYGRVLRWFKHEWPNAKITAVETDQIALDFCNSAFNADTILANAEMNFSIP